MYNMRYLSYNRPSNTRSRPGRTGTFTALATASTRRKLTRLLQSKKNVLNTENFVAKDPKNLGSLTIKI